LKGQQLQRIQTELSLRRQEVNDNVERAFVDIARVRLHPDTFQDFMNEANDRVREGL
jgi:PP-loop superfamily ATP-utilizing enzyme